MKLVYPACFYRDDETGAYAVEIPDLPGAASGGDTLADAILAAVDAASGWVLTELEDGRPPPAYSDICDITPTEGGFVSLLGLDMDAYAEKYGSQAVTITLTLPAWLNTFAETFDINLSRVLQRALSKMRKQRKK